MRMPDRMVSEGIAAAFLLLLLSGIPVHASTIDFGPPIQIMVGSEPLDAGHVITCTMTDWDGDGLEDLLVGSLAEDTGKVSLYLNSGVPGAPLFTGFSYLQADGIDIQLPTDDCPVSGATSPRMVDWNGDGREDIIVGDALGYINLFLRLSDGSLADMPHIEAGGVVIQVDQVSSPFITDWNEDGLFDLLIGSSLQGTGEGTMVVYINVGSPGFPEFDKMTYVVSGPYPFNESLVKPVMADLTGDSLPEVVYANGYAEFLYLHNTGDPGWPQFPYCDTLTSEGEPINLSYYGSVCVLDWNIDGTPDLLIGDFTGQLWICLGDPTGIGPWSSDPCAGMLLEPVTNPATGSLELVVTTIGVIDPTVSIYSLAGRLAAVLEPGVLLPGESSLTIDAVLPPGAYIAVLDIEGEVLASAPVVILPR